MEKGGLEVAIKTTMQYPGSKRRIANWIIENMHQHHSYVEPFAGMLAIYFRKEKSPIETINDIDGDIYNFFKQIRDNPEEFSRAIALTPYCRREHQECFSRENITDLERARLFAIRVMQGHSGRMNERTSWKLDVYGRPKSYAVGYWNEMPDLIIQMAERLKDAQIENRPAIDVIENFNKPGVLIYADPPYVLDTRSREQYRYEMTDKEHEEMLKVLLKHQGYVMLSGYDNEMYNDYLRKWHKLQLKTRAENNLERIETLWLNYEPIGQIKLNLA